MTQINICPEKEQKKSHTKLIDNKRNDKYLSGFYPKKDKKYLYNYYEISL